MPLIATSIEVDEVVDRQDVVSWWQGALGELLGFTTARGLHTTGPIGGLFASELLQDDRCRRPAARVLPAQPSRCGRG